MASGQVAGPIAGQLAHALEQAAWHLERERTVPAVRALDRFVRHLEHPARPDTLGEEARADLHAQVPALLAALG